MQNVQKGVAACSTRHITIDRFTFPSRQIGPMNIGNPSEFTIKELAEMTIRLTGSSSKIIYKPLPQVSFAAEVLGIFDKQLGNL